VIKEGYHLPTGRGEGEEDDTAADQRKKSELLDEDFHGVGDGGAADGAGGEGAGALVAAGGVAAGYEGAAFGRVDGREAHDALIRRRLRLQIRGGGGIEGRGRGSTFGE